LWQQDGHVAIPAKRNRSWQGAFCNIVVQKFEMYFLVLGVDPRKKQIGHTLVGFDIVIKQIVYCFIAACFQTTQPGTLDRFCGRCNHEEHEYSLTKTC